MKKLNLTLCFIIGLMVLSFAQEKSVKDLLKDGKKKLALGYYKVALADFSKVVLLDSSLKEVFLLKANAAMELKKYSIAEESYTKFMYFKPNDLEAHEKRGKARRSLEKYDLAIEDFSKAISLSPRRAENYTARAKVLSEINYYDWALKDFDKAVKYNKKNAMAYFNRGECLRDLKKYDKAIKDLTKAIELKKDFKEAYCERGYAKKFAKDYESSLADFNKALEIDPDFGDAYMGRGITKKKIAGKNGEDSGAKDRKKALNMINSGLDRILNKIDSLNAIDTKIKKDRIQTDKTIQGVALGKNIDGFLDYPVFLDSRDIARNISLISDYTKKIKEDDSNYMLYHKRGMLKYLNEDYEAALVDFEKVLSLKENPISYCNVGLTLVELKKYDLVIKNMDKAIKMDENYTKAYRIRGFAKYQSGDFEKGCKDFHLAKEKGDLAAEYNISKYCY